MTITSSLFFLLFVVSSVFGQTVYRIRMPHKNYSARLIGVAGTNAAGETITGAYDAKFGTHEFLVTKTGGYDLQYDPDGGTSWTTDTDWDAGQATGKYLVGTDVLAAAETPTFDGSLYVTGDTLSITSATNGVMPVLMLTNTYNAQTARPTIQFYNSRTTETDADYIGRYEYYANNDAGAKHLFGAEYWEASDVSDGAEAGRYYARVYVNGAAYDWVCVDGAWGGVPGQARITFNYQNTDMDARFMTSAGADNLFMDAGLNEVIKTNGIFRIKSSGQDSMFVVRTDNARVIMKALNKIKADVDTLWVYNATKDSALFVVGGSFHTDAELTVNNNVKANGTIWSTSGGIIFPDGSTQTSASGSWDPSDGSLELTGDTLSMTSATNGTYPAFYMTNTYNSAATRPLMEFYNNRASPADGDDILVTNYYAKNSAGAKHYFGHEYWEASDVEDGHEAGRYSARVYVNGESKDWVYVDGAHDGAQGEARITLNHQAANMDLHILGVTTANYIYYDVGINELELFNGRLRIADTGEDSLFVVRNDNNRIIAKSINKFRVDADTVWFNTSSRDSILYLAGTTFHTDANASVNGTLKANGYIYSTLNGFMFPDGTIQTTAASAAANAVLQNGSTPLTADWDAGSYTIRALKFYSDQATGTAPLTVSSTTKVSNLNVDYLDGISSESFQPIDADLTDLADGHLTISKLDALTASRALVSSSLGVITASSITDVELGYLSGVDSNIQDQLDAIPTETNVLLKNGSVELTADWDAGEYKITSKEVRGEDKIIGKAIGDYFITDDNFPGKMTLIRNEDMNNLQDISANVSDECLDDNAIATGAPWDVTGKCSDAGGDLEWTYAALDLNGTAVQTAANRLVAGENSRWYEFTYTVTVTTAPDGNSVLSIEDFADVSTPLQLAAGTYTERFRSASDASTQDFTLKLTETSAAQGQFALDNVYLKRCKEITIEEIDYVNNTLILSWVPYINDLFTPVVGKEWALLDLENCLPADPAIDGDYSSGLSIDSVDYATRTAYYRSTYGTESTILADHRVMLFNPFRSGSWDVDLAEPVIPYAGSGWRAYSTGNGGIFQHSDGTYYMLVNGWQTNSASAEKTGVFTSTDLDTWTARGDTAIWTGSGTGDWRHSAFAATGPLLKLPDEDRYICYGYGWNATGSHYSLGWVKFNEDLDPESYEWAPEEILDSSGSSSGFYMPSVIRYGGKYRMLYQDRKDGNLTVTAWETREATADNPTGPWTDQGAILTGLSTNQGTWRSSHMGGNCLFLWKGKLYATMGGTARYKMSGTRANRCTGLLYWNNQLDTPAWVEDPRSPLFTLPFYGAYLWNSDYEWCDDHDGGSNEFFVKDETGEIYFFISFGGGGGHYQVGRFKIDIQDQL